MRNYTLNETRLQELKSKIKECKEDYAKAIDILEKLKTHLKTKKDGSDFKNVKMIFDIDNFKYDYKIYLDISDYDFMLYYYNNQHKQKYIYIKRRFYVDEYKPEEQNEIRKKYNCIKQTYLREYYNITSKEDITKQIDKAINNYKNWLKNKTIKEKQITFLEEAAKNFINELNKNCLIYNDILQDKEATFYNSEVASIFNY